MKATVITFLFALGGFVVLFYAMSHGPLWTILLYPLYYAVYMAIIFGSAALYGMLSGA